MIEDAMVDASISCPVTADVWKKQFRGKVEVPFVSFGEHFFSALGEKLSTEGIKYRCLERLLVCCYYDESHFVGRERNFTTLDERYILDWPCESRWPSSFL